MWQTQQERDSARMASLISIEKEILSRLDPNDAYLHGHGVKTLRRRGSKREIVALGLLSIYISVCLDSQAQDIAVVGSGTGIVPMILRTTQVSGAFPSTRTLLIDACMPEAGFGGPFDAGGWCYPDSRLMRHAADVEILFVESEAGASLLSHSGIALNLLFLDGDHGRHQVLRDLIAYEQIMKRNSVILLHDFNTTEVVSATAKFLELHPEWHLAASFEDGAGLGILIRDPSSEASCDER